MYLGKGAWIVKYARRGEPFIVTKNMYVYMYTYKFTMPHVLFFLPLPKHMRGIYKQKDTYRSCRHKQIGGRRMYQNSGSKFSYTTSWLSQIYVRKTSLFYMPSKLSQIYHATCTISLDLLPLSKYMHNTTYIVPIVILQTIIKKSMFLLKLF